jgi:hypothetical protein
MRGPKPSSIAPRPCARRERSLRNGRPAPRRSRCARLPRRRTARLRLRRSVVKTWTARPRPTARLRLCRSVVETRGRGVVKTLSPRHRCRPRHRGPQPRRPRRYGPQARRPRCHGPQARRPRCHGPQARRPAARPYRRLCPDGQRRLDPSPSLRPWPSRRWSPLPPRSRRKALGGRRHRALGCRALLRRRRAPCRFNPNRDAPSFSIDCASERRHSRRQRSNRSWPHDAPNGREAPHLSLS